MNDTMMIRNPETNEWESVYLPPSGDTLPIGSEVEFDGDKVPTGWKEVQNPDEYSENEIKTNKIWFGKSVYRKLYKINALKSNDITVIQHGIDDLEDVVEIRAIGRSSADQQYPIPFVGNEAMFSGTTLTIRATLTEIVIANKADGTTDLSKHSATIIMEYTKSTDEEA